MENLFNMFQFLDWFNLFFFNFSNRLELIIITDQLGASSIGVPLKEAAP